MNMRNLKNIINNALFIALISFGISACEQAYTTENISTITYFPTIELKGNQWNTLAQGAAWTDPGVTAKEGTSELKATTSGVVNTAVPGVYTIKYTAVNKDGYSTSEYRYVGVISPSVAGVDMSGSYKRNAGALGVSNVTKVADNFFYANNVGGVATPDPSLGVYFFLYDTGKLGVPFQKTPGNSFECTNATVKLGVSYSWVVINGGYGTALRTFVKQ